MSAQEIALNELQWRSAQITASAGEAVARVLRQPISALKHYSVLRSLNTVTATISEFLTFIHTADSIAALEAAAPEQLHDIGRQLEDACSKLQMLIAKTDVFSRAGTWRRWYAPRLEKVSDSNRQLRTHANALRSRDSSLILLTKRDQEFLLEELLNPKEPSEDLRRVFKRRQ